MLDHDDDANASAARHACSARCSRRVWRLRRHDGVLRRELARDRRRRPCPAAAARAEAAAPPPSPSASRSRQDKIVINEKIQFDFNKATIKPESHGLLDEIVSVIKENPHIKKISIEGHTDSDGSDNYNLKLSDDRAESVMKYLTEHGIDAGRLDRQGLRREQADRRQRHRRGQGEEPPRRVPDHRTGRGHQDLRDRPQDGQAQRGQRGRRGQGREGQEGEGQMKTIASYHASLRCSAAASPAARSTRATPTRIARPRASCSRPATPTSRAATTPSSSRTPRSAARWS